MNFIRGPCPVMKEEPKGLHEQHDRTDDGCWCCGHMLFGGRASSQDKKEEEDEQKKKKIKRLYMYVGYFYCRSFIGWCIYIFIYLSMFIFFRSFYFLSFFSIKISKYKIYSMSLFSVRSLADPHIFFLHCPPPHHI